MSSLLQALNFHIKLLRLWGMYPMKISASEIKPFKIYQGISICMAVCSTSYFIWNQLSSVKPAFYFYISELCNYVAIVTMCLFWLNSALRGSKVQAMFDTFLEVDRYLLKAELTVDYVKLRHKTYFGAGALIIFCIVIPNIMDYLYPLFDYPAIEYHIFRQYRHIFILFISYDVGLLVMCVYERYKIINLKLAELTSNAAKRRNMLILHTIAKLNSKPKCVWTEEATSSETLFYLQKSHMLLTKLMANLIEVRRWPIVLIVFQQFTALVSTLFFSLILVFTNKVTTILVGINLCKLMSGASVILLLLTVPFTYVCDEANETQRYLLEYLLELVGTENKYKQQLEFFVLQVSRPLSFKPLGLFSLESSLFLVIWGTTITYVMILLQVRPEGTKMDSWFDK